jgi:hypothetical protein
MISPYSLIGQLPLSIRMLKRYRRMRKVQEKQEEK